jgi:isoquinoline 1-oxidoreductase beta subunit
MATTLHWEELRRVGAVRPPDDGAGRGHAWNCPTGECKTEPAR